MRPRVSLPRPLLLQRASPTLYARKGTAHELVEVRARSHRRSNPNGTPDPETPRRGRKVRAVSRISNCSAELAIARASAHRIAMRRVDRPLFLRTPRPQYPSAALRA